MFNPSKLCTSKWTFREHLAYTLSFTYKETEKFHAQGQIISDKVQKSVSS